nr:hypothetical protein [Tanacetum cinerariifolium]
MAVLVPDIIEQILVRLDVSDLIRCKSVCKSWQYLISDPPFVRNHLNRSYKNNEFGHRRITKILKPNALIFKGGMLLYLIGSSNGLTCLITLDHEIVVVNPVTREFKKLPNICGCLRFWEFCFGFGYDRSTDDYKVVVGFLKPDRICFQVLCMKFNVWKVIGDVKYTPITLRGAGILCNGALHWVMNIDSPSTSPSPSSQKKQGMDMILGIIEECLCILPHELIPGKIWIMKKYNEKQSWGMLGQSQECELHHEVSRFFTDPKNCLSYGRCPDRFFYQTQDMIQDDSALLYELDLVL